MAWDHLEKSSKEEVVEGVMGAKAKKEQPPEVPAMKCPSCGAEFQLVEKQEELKENDGNSGV